MDSREIDRESRLLAYALFDEGILDEIEVGTAKGLRQIHGRIFKGLYPFAGEIRKLTIFKGGFAFANADYLEQTLENIDAMPESTIEEIVDKYVEMNIAHPFMEGNGRATRIWLDLILKKNLGTVTDWSLIGKEEYKKAMKRSPVDPRPILELIRNAQTDEVDDRDAFIRGIDRSYDYEAEG